jgi:hypothetical protein
MLVMTAPPTITGVYWKTKFNCLFTGPRDETTEYWTLDRILVTPLGTATVRKLSAEVLLLKLDPLS